MHTHTHTHTRTHAHTHTSTHKHTRVRHPQEPSRGPPPPDLRRCVRSTRAVVARRARTRRRWVGRPCTHAQASQGEARPGRARRRPCPRNSSPAGTGHSPRAFHHLRHPFAAAALTRGAGTTTHQRRYSTSPAGRTQASKTQSGSNHPGGKRHQLLTGRRSSRRCFAAPARKRSSTRTRAAPRELTDVYDPRRQKYPASHGPDAAANTHASAHAPPRTDLSALAPTQPPPPPARPRPRTPRQPQPVAVVPARARRALLGAPKPWCANTA